MNAQQPDLVAERDDALRLVNILRQQLSELNGRFNQLKEINVEIESKCRANAELLRECRQSMIKKTEENISLKVQLRALKNKFHDSCITPYEMEDNAVPTTSGSASLESTESVPSPDAFDDHISLSKVSKSSVKPSRISVTNSTSLLRPTKKYNPFICEIPSRILTEGEFVKSPSIQCSYTSVSSLSDCSANLNINDRASISCAPGFAGNMNNQQNGGNRIRRIPSTDTVILHDDHDDNEPESMDISQCFSIENGPEFDGDGSPTFSTMITHSVTEDTEQKENVNVLHPVRKCMKSLVSETRSEKTIRLMANIQSPRYSHSGNSYSADYLGIDGGGSSGSSDEGTDISYMTDNTFMMIDMEECAISQPERQHESHDDTNQVLLSWSRAPSTNQSFKIVLHDENDEAVSVVTK